jgi:hypothetical protein
VDERGCTLAQYEDRCAEIRLLAAATACKHRLGAVEIRGR